MERCCLEGRHRFGRYMEMEGGSQEEKMLEEENCRGHGLKMGHSILVEED